MPGSLQKGGGTNVISWRRYNTSLDNASGIAPNNTALTELTGAASYMQGRTPDTVHFTEVTATMAKYGQYYILSEEVDLYVVNPTGAGIVDTLAITAGRNLNQLQRNVAEDNVTLLQTGQAASDGAQSNVITLNAIKTAVIALNTNAALPFTPLSGGSQNVGTSPILPAFWFLCHPHVADDVAGLTGFAGVQSYTAHTDTVAGEFGMIPAAGFAVRCVQSPDAGTDADLGAAGAATAGVRGVTKADLYTSVIYGRDAIGSVGLGRAHTDGIYRAGDDTGMFEIIAKGAATNRMSGTSDPFDEITTVAYKFFHAGAVLNANFARGIRSAATLIQA
jgi:N4-gp56 family major capsid protein